MSELINQDQLIRLVSKVYRREVQSRSNVFIGEWTFLSLKGDAVKISEIFSYWAYIW